MLPGRMRGDVPPPVYGTGTDDNGACPFPRTVRPCAANGSAIRRYGQVRQGLPVAAMTHPECITAGLSQRGTPQ